MKLLYTYLAIAFILFSAPLAVAQKQTVKYLNNSGTKEVTPSEAHYFEIWTKDEANGGTRARFLAADSTKVSLFTYSDLEGGKYEGGILHGPSFVWFQNGKLKQQGEYSNDKAVGEHKIWYESGQLLLKENYINGMLQDTFLVYFENGKVRRTEVYDQNKLVTGTLFDESGNEIEYIPRYVMPEFPNGETALQMWLARNVKYPKRTRKAKAQGTVLVAFTIDKAGKVAEAEVIKGIHPDADIECLRVVNAMPRWQPGLLEGEPVPVRYTVPVRFSIN